ncbi:hypothetical protein [Massilia agri]|uniref:DUF1795 domain-containing protein n=1 Tax=Massilia agri TaxID=1886785 RepID=A0ABT2ASR9_9BURK|nr:hypothetical protein [Massilia agri]MCS0599225.1 hypothetical protein [Massilia agri]
MHRFTHALAALVLAAPAALAFAGDTNAFSNPTAGFALTKPAGWHYLSAAQNMDNIKRMKLCDEEFHAMMKQYASAPLVAMSKYQEPFEDVNPSFKVNLKTYGQLKGIPATELIKLILPQFQKTFRDFVLVQAPVEVQVAGIQSAYARIDYTMELPDGRSFPTSSELWIVPRGDYFFMIGAGTRQDEKTGTRAEIQGILDTVKITQ